MRNSTIGFSILAGGFPILAGVALMLAASPAFAQAGTTAMPPVSNQATKGQTDAAKQAMDAERRRKMMQEEEKAKKAAQKK